MGELGNRMKFEKALAIDTPGPCWDLWDFEVIMTV